MSMHVTVLKSNTREASPFWETAEDLAQYLQQDKNLFPPHVILDHTVRHIGIFRNNVLPGVMEQDHNLWIAVYESLQAQELMIILPLAGALDTFPKLLREVSSVTTDEEWHVAAGYQNLRRLLEHSEHFRWAFAYEILATNYQIGDLFEGHPRVAQQVGINEPQREADSNATQMDSATTEVNVVAEEEKRILRDRVAATAQKRSDYLAALVEDDDLSDRLEKREELENSFLQGLETAASVLDNYPVSPFVQSFLDEFGDVLDPESRKFLISSDKVWQAVQEHNLEYFDYALPGSGLWKSVERELNVSVIWLLRVNKAVGSRNDPWTPADSYRDAGNESLYDPKDGLRKIPLNKRDKVNGERFQGIELGGINRVLKHWNSSMDHDPFVQKMTRPLGKPMWNIIRYLPSVLLEVANIRNRYAHVEAMPEIRYEKLQKYVLDPTAREPTDTTLGKILRLKRKVLQNMGPLHAARVEPDTKATQSK